MDVTVKKTLKYACLPGLLPRIKSLFGSGFTYIAFFIAQAFSAVNLLPARHPYLQPANIGRFGIYHVLSEAWQKIEFTKKNIDKIIIYFTTLIGIFLMFFQALVIGFQLLINTASAQTFNVWLSDFFVDTSTSEDIAFRLLDRVFCLNGAGGAPPVYNSDVVTSATCPTALTESLHTFFEFYNLGLVAVAIIISLYLIASIVGETAQSGTPFGKRFNRAVTPLRIIFAIALLVPYSYGFNGAQHITFRVVKWGSNLGTNAWEGFLDELNTANVMSGTNFSAAGVERASMIATPNAPSLNNFLEYMFLLHTCKYAEEWINHRQSSLDINPADGKPDGIGPYQVNGEDFWYVDNTYSYAQAVGNSDGEMIKLRFGIRDPRYVKQEGEVYPFCGSINLRVTDVSSTISPGSYEIQRRYFEEIIRQVIWDPAVADYAKHTVKRLTPTSWISANDTHKEPTTTLYPSSTDIENDFKDFYNTEIENALVAGVAAQRLAPDMLTYATNHGWAGAGLWYNKIAELNGTLSSSVNNLPTADMYPTVMQYIQKQREAHDAAMDPDNRFSPYLSDGKIVPFQQPGDLYVGMILNYAKGFWPERLEKQSASPVGDIIKAWFGVEGLYNIRDNIDVHPLAQLAAIGRSLLESAVMNLGAYGVAGVAGFAADKVGFQEGSMLAKAISGFSFKVATIGLSMGFILFYVIPFLPFIYFFFAIGGWIKSIFEALVGMPLWAIAHISIEGDGIPGPSGMNGYYLLLEIFLRPVLIIIGLVAGILILSAEVSVLNQIWDLVTTNVAGNDASAPAAGTTGQIGSMEYFRTTFDQFFYLVIYTIIVYMMAMSSFKLIDLIPKSILRWAGSSVPTLTDYEQDAAASLVRYMLKGSSALLAKSSGALDNLVGRN